MKFIHKKDLIWLAGILLAAVLIYAVNVLTGSGAEEVYAHITVDGRAVLASVDLSVNRSFVLPQNPAVRFEVRDGSIAFAASDCPDQICVHSGFLRRPGQTAVCLPNRVALRVAGGRREVDATAY